MSALETLKGLKKRETVSLGDLVRFLESRGLWSQFRKITLGDLRQAFAPEPPPESAPENGRRKKPRRILEDELAEVEAEAKSSRANSSKKRVDDGGMTTEEFAQRVLPFVEGNGDVTVDDIADYTDIERKVLRYHLGALVRQGRLERLGIGRTALYSTL